MAKQALGVKKTRQCSKLLGAAVIKAFANGDLPHNVALAFTDEKNAFFVNFKTEHCIQYLFEGEFCLHRVKPIEIKPSHEPEEAYKVNELDGEMLTIHNVLENGCGKKAVIELRHNGKRELFCMACGEELEAINDDEFEEFSIQAAEAKRRGLCL